MHNIKPPSITLVFFVLCGFLSVAFIMGFSCAKLNSYAFYDDKGNIIPYYAVDSLVHNQFTSISKPGTDTLIKYFDAPPIDLPEEYRLIKSTDTLKGYWENGAFHIEFNNKNNE